MFTYQKHRPVAYERLVQMFAEIGVTLRACKPTMNIDHVQWMTKEGACYSLIRAEDLWHLASPPGESKVLIGRFDSAIVCNDEHRNPALSLLIEELLNRYGMQPIIPEKRPALSVKANDGLKRVKGQRDREQMPLFDSKMGSYTPSPSLSSLGLDLTAWMATVFVCIAVFLVGFRLLAMMAFPTRNQERLHIGTFSCDVNIRLLQHQKPHGSCFALSSLELLKLQIEPCVQSLTEPNGQL